MKITVVAHGISGSWVVREEKLCGVIYATYDRIPYFHMLPAEQIFENIAELLHTSPPFVRVASVYEIASQVKESPMKAAASRLKLLEFRKKRSKRGHNSKLVKPVTPIVTAGLQSSIPIHREELPRSKLLCHECHTFLCRPGQTLCLRCLTLRRANLASALVKGPENHAFDPFRTFRTDTSLDSISELLKHCK